ncbi:MAG: transcription antitermination factor NusB, partial [Roseiflexus sp.]|nr:transcription antitermination factor NusB [Roseiflexus sp.]
MASLRRRVRAIALQILFELDATDHSPDQVVARRLEEERLPPEGERFLRRLVFGAWEHASYLDRIIEETAPNWPVSQMPGVDKAILRIALFEALIDEEEKTPLKAIINEAVELA